MTALEGVRFPSPTPIWYMFRPMKVCTKCKEEKPLDCYTKKNNLRSKLEARCRDCRKREMKIRYDEERLEALRHYSDGQPKCACCGELQPEFLTFDHVNGKGSQHRRFTKGASLIGYWLKKNGYPEGFRILCMNCNMSMGKHGYCPHQMPL